MNGRRRFASCIAVIGLFAAIAQQQVWAACSFVSPPRPVSASASWTTSRSIPGRLNTNPLRTEFSFKCDADTDYWLQLNDTAGLPRGWASIQHSSGTAVTVQPILHSVGGRVENVQFSSLPVMGYQGRAVAGQVYLVNVDMLVQGQPQSGVAASSGQFTGSLVFLLQF